METKGGFLMSRIKQVGSRLFDRMMSESGVDAFNGAQGRILYVLWQQDGISISRLSTQTGLANTTLTSMLDRMEASGLVERRAVPGDRRQTHIVLTEKARGLRGDFDRISQQANEAYYKGFTEQEIRQFEVYLLRILDNLEGDDHHDKG